MKKAVLGDSLFHPAFVISLGIDSEAWKRNIYENQNSPLEPVA